MQTITIGKRVYLLAGLLCAIIAGMSVFAVVTLNQIKTSSDVVTRNALPGLEGASTANAGQSRAQLAVARYLRAETGAQREALRRELDDIGTEVTAALETLKGSLSSAEERALFEQFLAARVTYRQVRDRLLTLAETDKEKATAMADGEMRVAYNAYLKIGNDLATHNKRMAESTAGTLRAQVSRGVFVFIVCAVIVVIAGIASSILVVRRIVHALGEVVSSVSAGSDQIASASGQVSSTSQSLAEGASEQAASLEETSASLEEMASMTRRNADNAQEAKTTATHTREAADRGATSMQQMQTAMEAIQVASNDIAKILKTIDEIAFQTNILALNAAVEAARAGEAGAGFAVVADEVRALAQRCAAAAKETAGKIEDSVSKSQQGAAISTEVAKSFGEITTQVRQLDELVAEIANASREQSQGIQQVTSAVSQMDKVTQANASNAEETAAAAEELSSQAMMLKDAVRNLQELAGAAAGASAPVRGSAPSRTVPTNGTRRPAASTPPAAPRHQPPAQSSTPVRHEAPALVVPSRNGQPGHGEDQFFR